MSLLFPPKYIFDSGPFIRLRDYPPDIFPSVWDNLNRMFKSGEIVSCREVYNELTMNFAGDDETSKWAKKNSTFFHKPNASELAKVSQILLKFPHLIKEEISLSTSPQADPFVIAQASVNGCVLVHQEKYKPNAPKIPNVCEHFGVKEMSLHNFFREQGWRF